MRRAYLSPMVPLKRKSRLSGPPAGGMHKWPSSVQPSRAGAPAPHWLLHPFAAEEEHQLDYQNDHYHQLQHEGAALVELVHHEAVELFGGA